MRGQIGLWLKCNLQWEECKRGLWRLWTSHSSISNSRYYTYELICWPNRCPVTNRVYSPTSNRVTIALSLNHKKQKHTNPKSPLKLSRRNEIYTPLHHALHYLSSRNYLAMHGHELPSDLSQGLGHRILWPNLNANQLDSDWGKKINSDLDLRLEYRKLSDIGSAKISDIGWKNGFGNIGYRISAVLTYRISGDKQPICHPWLICWWWKMQVR